MTKAEIIEKLEEEGVEYDASATKAQLEALLPEEAPEEVQEEAEAELEAGEAEVVEEEEDETPAKKGSVAVVTYAGRTREYTKEIHGKDFKKLAEQFASKYRDSSVEVV